MCSFAFEDRRRIGIGLEHREDQHPDLDGRFGVLHESLPCCTRELHRREEEFLDPGPLKLASLTLARGP